MYNVQITGDKELLAALDRLSSKGLSQTIKTTLNRVSGLLQAEAKKNLRSVTNRYNVSGSTTSKGTRKKPLQQGITKKVWKSNEGATVTILGDYRLKFFEIGTSERKTKGKLNSRYRKPKATGKMTATHFFGKAISNQQKTASDDINKTLTKEINKRFTYK